MPAQLTTIPLKLIQPHPKLAFRFSYDVAGLADSIRSAADENTPNGQLNPGRVVLRSDGEGYYVYVGVRRYHALKLLYETTKDERFGSYTAYIDTGMDELQMFVKAKRENDEERGERQGLSVLEEVYGLTKIRDAIKPEGLEKGLKRLVDVADKVTLEKIRKLFEIEVATRFRFRLPHLEYICKIEGEADFYLTAATAAGYGYKGEDMDRAWEDRNSAYSLEWFRRVFSQYEQPKPEAGGTATSQGGQAKKQKPAKAKGKAIKGLEIHEKSVITASCPRCRTLHMVQMKGKIEATHLPADPEGESRTEVTDSVSRLDCTCSACKGRFFLFVKHLEGRRYAAEPSPSMKFREPRETVEAVDLRYDHKEEMWQKIAGDKIVGPLLLRAGAGKRR
ncbi:MAG: ParB/RepB/Spo0J family partition protein [Nitrososphaerales archaeon]|nr:ParB/RepB/Spo0J family partition protein [Nitrososphaerales archaeon]